MRPELGNAQEQWGVLNPGGARGLDGQYHLFPRRVAAGNYSRIGHATAAFDEQGTPVGVNRLSDALEPTEPYELTAEGHGAGGVEDARVTYVETLGLFVMTYTAFRPPYDPRVAMAVSPDLLAWTRLGPVEYGTEHCLFDLNQCGNKDAVCSLSQFPAPTASPRLPCCTGPPTRCATTVIAGKRSFLPAAKTTRRTSGSRIRRSIACASTRVLLGRLTTHAC